MPLLADRFRPLSPLIRGLVVAYSLSGSIHLVRPGVFEPIVPKQLPRKRELVYASGVAELACAAGFLDSRTRRAAGAASALLLVSVLPANVEMSRQAWSRLRRRGATPARVGMLVATGARIPVQWPLINASFKVARSSR